MEGPHHRERATAPEALSRLVVDRLNAADLDGLVALYEPDALLALPGGEVAAGAVQIRAAYRQLLTEQRTYVHGDRLPPLVHGDIALTTSRLADGQVTAEVARRQPDGAWLWIIDRPALLPPGGA
jgi:ketosteroid isomerase-like protein